MNPFGYLGSFVLNLLNTLGGLSTMLWDALRWTVRPPFRFKLILEQMESIGVKSVPVVIFTGMFTGMVFGYQCYFGFHYFGAEYMTGMVVALAMARELGPVLSAIMVTARCGSAMTAELGTMRVTEQIDALYSLAVEPLQYLISPRIIASVLIMPVLNLITVTFGIVGGYVVVVKWLGVNSTIFLENISYYVGLDDYLNGTVKALVFGLILSVVGCYKGYYVSGGALGVGQATTQSVVLSCILILLFDYIITALLF
ncbi:MAG: ABC transporter permease [Deferribacteraceae bacterium]|jgi:phospholipid/cholesterol/gamma-HCH transport system permease protein|nr:ABC transporter permease [Deferribacteraceae bacterium]